MKLRAMLLVVRRSLQQHRLAGWITTLSVALACALLLTITGLQNQAQAVFAGQTGGFDAVLGARGSPLQLVLAALYHLESPPANLDWSSYQQFSQDPQVAAAIPIALGDNYQGYRIVGTLPEFFQAWWGGLRCAEGRIFDGPGQAVIGSRVAEQSDLKVGSHFHPAHGLDEGGEAHNEDYQVVGRLAPTNTPQDRAIWIPLEGVYRMSGHVLRGSGQDYVPRPEQPIPPEHQEVTAVLLRFKSPQIGMQFEERINRLGKVSTLAWPVGKVLYDFLDKLGWMMTLLQLTSWLVLLVAVGSITASLSNTLQERRREFAILRALGASRGFVTGVIALQSCCLSFLGTALGILGYYALMVGVAAWFKARTGLSLDPWAFHPGLLLAPVVASALGLLAGLAPMLQVYRSSVAPHLNSAS